MAVGLPLKTTYADGDVYSASDVNDTNGTVNLVGQTNNFYAAKNKIINADFRFNQRSFTSTTISGTYGFDRWVLGFVSDGTVTYSAQTFTAGTAPVAGYEAINFARIVTSGQTLSSAASIFGQAIEDVRTFAGQTATLSFWAKTASGTPKVAIELQQNFGTGGSPSAAVTTYAGQSTLSTSWARYSITVAVPSISGKTVGTTANTSSLGINIWTSAGSTFNSRTGSLGIQNTTIDIWGVQFESGSTATAFQTASGSIGGELALCQRYYARYANEAANNILVISGNYSTTQAIAVLPFITQMRVAPTVSVSAAADFGVYSNNGFAGVTGFSAAEMTTKAARITFTCSVLVQGATGFVQVSAANKYLETSAEL
jgi:hypothetical protein